MFKKRNRNIVVVAMAFVAALTLFYRQDSRQVSTQPPEAEAAGANLQILGWGTLGSNTGVIGRVTLDAGEESLGNFNFRSCWTSATSGNGCDTNIYSDGSYGGPPYYGPGSWDWYLGYVVQYVRYDISVRTSEAPGYEDTQTCYSVPTQDDCVFVPPDTDGDGVVDYQDSCPTQGGIVDVTGCPNDTDSDTIPDGIDNCINIQNMDQADNDLDGEGDVCDLDDDNDGVNDATPDNCQFVSNADQADNDLDGAGDACDPDDDNDGVNDATPDNCQFVSNADQADNEADGIGDVCDPDDDNDGVNDDVPDNCPTIANADQSDIDSDTLGDACDPDRDGDELLNEEDNCPNVFNPAQYTLFPDGVGDDCDPDFDNDGFNNDSDACEVTASREGVSGCPDGDLDGFGELPDYEGEPFIANFIPDECENEYGLNNGCPSEPGSTPVPTTEPGPPPNFIIVRDYEDDVTGTTLRVNDINLANALGNCRNLVNSVDELPIGMKVEVLLTNNPDERCELAQRYLSDLQDAEYYDEILPAEWFKSCYGARVAIIDFFTAMYSSNADYNAILDSLTQNSVCEIGNTLISGQFPQQWFVSVETAIYYCLGDVTPQEVQVLLPLLDNAVNSTAGSASNPLDCSTIITLTNFDELLPDEKELYDTLTSPDICELDPKAAYQYVVDAVWLNVDLDTAIQWISTYCTTGIIPEIEQPDASEGGNFTPPICVNSDPQNKNETISYILCLLSPQSPAPPSTDVECLFTFSDLARTPIFTPFEKEEIYFAFKTEFDANDGPVDVSSSQLCPPEGDTLPPNPTPTPTLTVIPTNPPQTPSGVTPTPTSTPVEVADDTLIPMAVPPSAPSIAELASDGNYETYIATLQLSDGRSGEQVMLSTNGAIEITTLVDADYAFPVYIRDASFEQVAYLQIERTVADEEDVTLNLWEKGRGEPDGDSIEILLDNDYTIMADYPIVWSPQDSNVLLVTLRDANGQLGVHTIDVSRPNRPIRTLVVANGYAATYITRNGEAIYFLRDDANGNPQLFWTGINDPREYAYFDETPGYVGCDSLASDIALGRLFFTCTLTSDERVLFRTDVEYRTYSALLPSDLQSAQHPSAIPAMNTISVDLDNQIFLIEFGEEAPVEFTDISGTQLSWYTRPVQ